MSIAFKPRKIKKSLSDKTNLILKKGEVVFEIPETGIGTGTGRIKMGDGKTPYKDLVYFDSPAEQTVHSKPEISSDSDYLYFLNYKSLNYQDGLNWFNSDQSNAYIPGGCSSLRCDNSFGRNYDWEFDDSAMFYVNTANTGTYYAAHGFTSKLNSLTKEFVDGGQSSDLYNVLPYLLIDGVNEKGFGCNINVVHASNTVGETKPGATKVCNLMIVSWLLHRCASVQEALTELKNISIYPHQNMINKYGYDIHIMLNDINDCYVVEFENSNMYFINMNTGKYTEVIKGVESEEEIEIPNLAGKLCMTNCKVKNLVINEDGTIDKDAIFEIDPFEISLERWEILTAEDNSSDLMTKMKLAAQNNAYSFDTDPFWISEFSGKYPDGTEIYCNSDITDEAVRNVLEQIIDNYEAVIGSDPHDRFAENKPWQTVNTQVWDLETKGVDFCVQSFEDSYDTVIHKDISSGSGSGSGATIDDINSIIAIFGDAWDESTTYNAGDYVIYNKQMYKATDTSTGVIPSVDDAPWVLTNIFDELKALST